MGSCPGRGEGANFVFSHLGGREAGTHPLLNWTQDTDGQIVGGSPDPGFISLTRGRTETLL